VVPVSAVAGFQLDVLKDVLVSYLPEEARRSTRTGRHGPTTPEQIMVAELIREAALEGVRDELPHSIAVLVEEMGPREDQPDLIDVHAELVRRAPKPEGDRHRRQGRPAEGGRHPGPPADRGAPRQPGLPGPARKDRQGLAAQPQVPAPPRLLRLNRVGDGELNGVTPPGAVPWMPLVNRSFQCSSTKTRGPRQGSAHVRDGHLVEPPARLDQPCSRAAR